MKNIAIVLISLMMLGCQYNFIRAGDVDKPWPRSNFHSDNLGDFEYAAYKTNYSLNGSVDTYTDAKGYQCVDWIESMATNLNQATKSYAFKPKGGKLVWDEQSNSWVRDNDVLHAAICILDGNGTADYCASMNGNSYDVFAFRDFHKRIDIDHAEAKEMTIAEMRSHNQLVTVLQEMERLDQ